MSTHPSLKLRTPVAALAIIMAFNLAGCVGGAPAPTAAPPNPWLASSTAPRTATSGTPAAAAAKRAIAVGLPGSVRALRFTLAVPSGQADAEQHTLEVARGLMRAGLQLSDGPGDAHIEIHTTDSDADSTDELTMMVTVTHQGLTVESLVGRVSRTDRASAALQVDDLAQRLASSVNLRAFGEHVEEGRLAMIRANAPTSRPTEAQVDPTVLAEQAWRPAAMRRCRNSRSETACGWIREYVEHFPDGAHAAEARALLGLPVPRAPEASSLAAQ